MLFVHSCQSLGCAVDHLSTGHASEYHVPISPVDIQYVLLKHFAHCHQQAWPSQIVVLRSETLSLCNVLRSDYWVSMKWVVLFVFTKTSSKLSYNGTTWQIKEYQNPNLRLSCNFASQLHFLNLCLSWSKWHLNNLNVKHIWGHKDILLLVWNSSLFWSSQQMESVTIHIHTVNSYSPQIFFLMVKMSFWSRQVTRKQLGRKGRLSYLHEITVCIHCNSPRLDADGK